jgi:hypothetical protein
VKLNWSGGIDFGPCFVKNTWGQYSLRQACVDNVAAIDHLQSRLHSEHRIDLDHDGALAEVKHTAHSVEFIFCPIFTASYAVSFPAQKSCACAFSQASLQEPFEYHY